METKITKILLRRDTEANWLTSNVILDKGEPAVAIANVNGKDIITGLKIGDGNKTWSQLENFTGNFALAIQRILNLENEYSELNTEINGDPEVQGDHGLSGRVQVLEETVNDEETGMEALSQKVDDVWVNAEDKRNKVTELSSTVTNIQYPGAKTVYDAIQAEAHLRDEEYANLFGDINRIDNIIPQSAYDTGNELADKNFVNSSVATNTATFRGTYNVVSELGLTIEATDSQISEALTSKMSQLSIQPTNNDYTFVSFPDPTNPPQSTKYDRYKYNGIVWEYEYTLNNSSFTSNQWNAINSGITSQLVINLINGSIPYMTEEPQSDNDDGGIRIVVLDHEPDTRYNGYWYIVTEAQL